ncbi:unnamed protein product [Darwinula stevensoni]|uniref:Bromo domain-containing protein n=1 Tax=Darwinula stevensoni TaxID=69355 RepID=A0A7R8XCI2_9CRUS|nr:unnamed protein product [Darwinula stevensoni]CAG0892024.1 unnamed protein product [Darwinula stevensoni]
MIGDIQNWWEVPCIAHFCSLFRVAFELLDFDIEDLEEALLTDGVDTEADGSTPLVLRDLLVRLLQGILGKKNVSSKNYLTPVRQLCSKKWHEVKKDVKNPFLEESNFHNLSLKEKVQVLHALCDIRLDAEDVPEVLKNLEADSLRVEPLGQDEQGSMYWYFYGTRLYKEDLSPKQEVFLEKQKEEKKGKKERKGKTGDKKDMKPGPLWNVVCFTQEDWENLAGDLENSSSKGERALYRTLKEDFLPEIPRLFDEKDRLQRKRIQELMPRRTSTRLRSTEEKRQKQDETQNDYTSSLFNQSTEDLRVGMFKVLDYLENLEDSWPFLEPVQEEYAPNYYKRISKPMDLQTMEEKLEQGGYLSYDEFEADFHLIISNCRKYNGATSEEKENVEKNSKEKKRKKKEKDEGLGKKDGKKKKRARKEERGENDVGNDSEEEMEKGGVEKKKGKKRKYEDDIEDEIHPHKKASKRRKRETDEDEESEEEVKKTRSSTGNLRQARQHPSNPSSGEDSDRDRKTKKKEKKKRKDSVEEEQEQKPKPKKPGYIKNKKAIDALAAATEETLKCCGDSTVTKTESSDCIFWHYKGEETYLEKPTHPKAMAGGDAP